MSDGQGFQALGQGIAQAGDVLGRKSDRMLRSLQETQRTQATIALQQGFSELEARFEEELRANLAGRVGGDASRIRRDGDILDPQFRDQWMSDKMDEIINNAIDQNISTPAGRSEFANRAATIRAQYEELWKEKELNAIMEWERSITPRLLNDLIDSHSETPDTGIVAAQSLLQSMVEDGVWSVHQANEYLNTFKKGVVRNSVSSFIQQPIDENGEVIQGINEGHEAAKKKIDELFNNAFLGMTQEDRSDFHRMNDQNRESRIEQAADALDVQNRQVITGNILHYVRNNMSVQEANNNIVQALEANNIYQMLDSSQQMRIKNNAWSHLTRLMPKPDTSPEQRFNAYLDSQVQAVWAMANNDAELAQEMIREFTSRENIEQIAQDHGPEIATRFLKRFVSQDPNDSSVSREISDMMVHPLRGLEGDPVFREFDVWVRSFGLTKDSPYYNLEYKALAEFLGLSQTGTSHLEASNIDQERIKKYMNLRNLNTLDAQAEAGFFQRLFGRGSDVEIIAREGFDPRRAAELWNRHQPSTAGSFAHREVLSRVFGRTPLTSVEGTVNTEEIERAVVAFANVGGDSIKDIENDYIRRQSMQLYESIVAAKEIMNVTGAAFVDARSEYDGYEISNITTDLNSGNLIVHFNLFKDDKRVYENKRILIHSTDPSNIEFAVLSVYFDPEDRGHQWGRFTASNRFRLNDAPRRTGGTEESVESALDILGGTAP